MIWFHDRGEEVPNHAVLRWDFLHLGYYDDDCSLAPLEGRPQRIGSDRFLGMPAMPMVFSLSKISTTHCPSRTFQILTSEDSKMSLRFPRRQVLGIASFANPSRPSGRVGKIAPWPWKHRISRSMASSAQP